MYGQITGENGTGASILLFDSEGRIDVANERAGLLFGCSPKQLLGKSPDWLPPDIGPALQGSAGGSLESAGQTPGHAADGNLRVVRPNGAELRVRVSLDEVVTSRGRATIAVIQESDRQVGEDSGAGADTAAGHARPDTSGGGEDTPSNTEARLRQSQKLEALGQLASGIAHDFNNLLSVINGYSEILFSRLPATDPSRDLVNQINEAGMRAAALTRQLLTFSRKQVTSPRILSLNSVVADLERMLRRIIGEDIELAVSLQSGLHTVRTDRGQIEQVVMNLAVNARDAMPEGGRLTIETANVELDENYSSGHPEVTPGPYVLLAVSDTGCGMTEDIKRHVFEPFFTTKELNKGTGLGLAVVHGVVKQVGGGVEVYSEPNVGTTFKVYLPKVGGVLPLGLATETPHKTLDGSETILLVEDEEAVRVLTRYLLTERGYQVLEARNADEGLQTARSFGDPIHLLLTDVVMPGLSGQRLAAELRSTHPEAKILFISGYPADAVVRHGILEGNAPFLQKPFTPSSLARMVRQTLDGD